MRDYIDAGKLDKPAQVLELKETSPGVWEWAPVRRAWASITFQPKANLFSKVGIGARDAAVVVRRQSLTLHDALSWDGHHLFLTSIVPMGRNHMEVDTAVVETTTCRAQGYTTTVGEGNRPQKHEKPPVTFPGVLTEKYVRYETEDTYAMARRGLVLVTPKPIRLSEGYLVTVQDGPAAAIYNVKACHVLDPFKNEYEIEYSRDV